MSQPDIITQALQIPGQSWKQSYRDTTGRRGTLAERNQFKQEYVSEKNVNARMGEGAYQQMLSEAEQRQFGTRGVTPQEDRSRKEKREYNRFKRRFDRNLRKGKLYPRSTIEHITQTDTVSTNENVSYPALWIKSNSSYFYPYFQPYFYSQFYPQFLNSGNNSDFVSTETGDNPKVIDWNKEATTKFGTSGYNINDVIDFQKMIGLKGNAIDGKWGSNTDKAFEDWKKNNNIQENGFGVKSSEYFKEYLRRKQNNIPPLEQTSSRYINTIPNNLDVSHTNNVQQVSNNQNNSNQIMQWFTENDNFRKSNSGTPDKITVGGIEYPVFVTKKFYGQPYGIHNDETYAIDPQTGKIRRLVESGTGQVKGWAFGNAQFVDGEDWIDYYNISQLKNKWLTNNPEPERRNPLGGAITQEWKDWNDRYIMASQTGFKKQGGKMNKIKYFQQGGAATQQQDIQQQVIQLVQAAMQGDQKATDTVNQIMQAAQQGDQQAAQLVQMIQQVVEQMKGQATMAKWGSKLGYIRSLKYAKGGKTCPSCQNGGKSLQTTPIKKSTKKVEEKACGGKAKKRYFGGYI